MGNSDSKKKPIIYNIPDPESIEREGETRAHINAFYPEYRKYEEEFRNSSILSYILQSIQNFPSAPALGYRKPVSRNEFDRSYTWISYSDLNRMATNYAKNSRIRNLVTTKTLEDGKDWRFLGIFASNCPEWTIVDLACQLDDITSVTFYSTLGAESFDHIFKQTKCNTVCVTPENIQKLVEYNRIYKFENLRNVVVFNYTKYLSKERHELDPLKELQDSRITLFTDMLGESEKTDVELSNARPESTLTVCYTSGTTSLPKGAILSQRGFASQRYATADSHFVISRNDISYSYLPLAHVMERINVLILLSFGGRIGFLSGADVKKSLAEDLPILRPTLLLCVPRILIGFHQKVFDAFSKATGCKKSLIDKAIKSKRDNFQKTGAIQGGCYDSLVFKKVKEKLGGNVRLLITGSAPLPKDVSVDIKLLFSCPLVEGYGMTELCGASTVTIVSDTENLNVGNCIRVLKFKLVDKPELNYHSKTKLGGKEAPTGEICFKGMSQFDGYLLMPDKTAETLDEEGWLHTGDVGMIDPYNKGLKVIDRVKEIFKLNQGEYIAPAKLEGIYSKSPYVLQICIYGNSEKSYAIAIVVLNQDNTKQFLKQLGVEDHENLESHLETKQLISEIKRSFDQLAQENNFNSLEKPSKFILSLEEFSVANEMLTPTLKLIRKTIQRVYQERIDRAYSSN